LLPAVTETRFHRDEARWLNGAQLLRAWGNPFGERWQDEGYDDTYGTVDERNRRRAQPPLAMYVLGLGVLVQTGELPNNGYWIMTMNGRENRALGNTPALDHLRAARRTSAVIAALTVVGLYAIGTLLTNRVGGVVTGLAYALHPLVRDTASRAWSDPLLGLCIVLGALAGYRLVERATWGRAVIFGALLGLGAATKLSPLAVALAAGIIGALILLWQLVRHGRASESTHRLGFGLLIAPAVAFLTFVAVYPYLWTDPIGHTARMFEFRSESFEMQAQNIPAARVEDRADALRRIGAELGEAFSLGGLVAEHFPGDDPSWLRNVDLALATVGWLLLAAFALPRGPAGARTLMAAVILLQAGAVVAAMGVEYPRYMLPVVIAVAVGIGGGAGCVTEAVLGRAVGRPDRLRGSLTGEAPS